jgi:Ca-activated chloride channel family protein
LAVVPAPITQKPTFRADASLVPIVATATDEDDHLVPGLAATDFEVLDNGRAQPLVVFDADVTPIASVVTLDTSASMTPSLTALKYVGEQFVKLFPRDRARICVLNDRVGISDDFTEARDELARTIRALDFGNATRLYDALAAALDALQDARERRVLVVFSDGEDTASRSSSGAIVTRARAFDTMVYAIGFKPARADKDDDQDNGPDPVLRKLARDTGGGYLEGRAHAGSRGRVHAARRTIFHCRTRTRRTGPSTTTTRRRTSRLTRNGRCPAAA